MKTQHSCLKWANGDCRLWPPAPCSTYIRCTSSSLAMFRTRLNCHILQASSSSVNYISIISVATSPSARSLLSSVSLHKWRTQSRNKCVNKDKARTLNNWKAKPQPQEKLWHLHENAKKTLFVAHYGVSHIKTYLCWCVSSRSRYSWVSMTGEHLKAQ